MAELFEEEDVIEVPHHSEHHERDSNCHPFGLDGIEGIEGIRHDYAGRNHGDGLFQEFFIVCKDILAGLKPKPHLLVSLQKTEPECSEKEQKQEPERDFRMYQKYSYKPPEHESESDTEYVEDDRMLHPDGIEERIYPVHEKE